jgi:hypothetical protein
LRKSERRREIKRDGERERKRWEGRVREWDRE